jgi:hypothetical protein
LVVAAARAMADRFVTRRRRELQQASAEELRAEASRNAQHGEVELARRELERAIAERRVIERHFASWRLEQQKLADRRED